MEFPVSIIQHNASHVTKLYDYSDPKYEGLTVLSEHYYYHKPHGVLHKSLSENFRIIQCLFGVIRMTGPDIEIQMSRENKIQIIVHPQVQVQWTNISGKAVVTRKECTKHEQVE